MDVIFDNAELVARSFGYTVLLFILSGILALVWGTVLAALRVGPVAVLRAAGTAYVSLVRNTPLLMIFLFFQFAAPALGIKFTFVDIHIGNFDFTSFFTAAVVSLFLYTAAFVCEALRSGVNAVPMGQAEAARAIGLSFTGVLSQVVLPQAFRAAVPPLASTLIALLKNTSVAFAFGVIEATARMKGLVNDHADQRWAIFFFFALGYMILVEILSFASARLERKWRVA